MAEDLYLYGAGYPDVIKVIDAINRRGPAFTVRGVLDDTARLRGADFLGHPVLGGREALKALDVHTASFFNNVYATVADREKVTEVLAGRGCRFATLIHPAVDRSYAEIGHGTILPEGVRLGARVRIGNHCAVRYHAVINHDNVIGDHVFVGPGATLSGYVTVERGAYLGIGCVIKERVTIGAYSVVGAGAVVLRDVPPRTTVIGVPARAMLPAAPET